MKHQFLMPFAALFVLASLFLACKATRISPHYVNNHYLSLGESIMYNEDLSLYVPTYGDVVFERDARMLHRRLRNVLLPVGDSVLLYGYTSEPPHYAFVLTTGVGHDIIDRTADTFVFQRDTCVDDRHYSLFGFTDEVDELSTRKDIGALWARISFDSLYSDQFGSIMSITERKTNNVFEVLDYIEQFPVWTNQDQWIKTQLMLTYSSFLGNNATYSRELASLEARMMPDSVVRGELVKTTPICGDKVLDAIATAAQDRQVVMVNENHFYPNHRTLVYDLLDTLKAIGFRYLALEALTADQEEKVNLTGSLDLLSGFYTQEQQYARLLRKALALGYKLVAYENTDKEAEREAGQAYNLYEKTIGNDPEAKVLVLAGMDHILELPTSNGKKWMATLFKETYGIDPLTIDQNSLKHLRDLAPSGYLLVASEAFKDTRLTAVDYQLINNQPVAIHDWSFKYKYRNRHRDEVQVLLFATERPVHAAMAQELPYYTTLVSKKSTVKLPVFPNGQVLLIVYDRYGNMRESLKLK